MSFTLVVIFIFTCTFVNVVADFSIIPSPETFDTVQGTHSLCDLMSSQVTYHSDHVKLDVKNGSLVMGCTKTLACGGILSFVPFHSTKTGILSRNKTKNGYWGFEMKLPVTVSGYSALFIVRDADGDYTFRCFTSGNIVEKARAYCCYADPWGGPCRSLGLTSIHPGPLGNEYHEFGILVSTAPPTERCVQYFLDGTIIFSSCPYDQGAQSYSTNENSNSVNYGPSENWYMEFRIIADYGSFDGDPDYTGLPLDLKIRRVRHVENVTGYPGPIDDETWIAETLSDTLSDTLVSIDSELQFDETATTTFPLSPEILYIIGGGAAFVLFVLLCLIVLCVGVILVCMLVKKKKKGNEIDAQEDILLEENEKGHSSVQPKLKVKSELFTIKASDVNLKTHIGGGGGGANIYIAKWRKKTVAVKMFTTNTFYDSTTQIDYFEDFEKEVELMSSLRHPNIIQFFGAILDNPKVGIVLEYCSNGDVNNYILTQKNTGKQVSFKEKVSILTQVASALCYLHDLQVIHRDLKWMNVLMADNNTPKLIDFGTTKVIQKTSSANTKRIGTAAYMSPEITFSHTYDLKVDVYSFGIMIWELMEENFKPYGNELNIEFKVAQSEDFRPKMKNESVHPKWIIQLMKRCWKNDPSERPTFQEVEDTIASKGKM